MPHQKSSNAGPIAGGVVGGIAVLLLAMIGIWYYMRHRGRNERSEPSVIDPPAADADTQNPEHPIRLFQRGSSTAGIKGGEIPYATEEWTPAALIADTQRHPNDDVEKAAYRSQSSVGAASSSAATSSPPTTVLLASGGPPTEKTRTIASPPLPPTPGATSSPESGLSLSQAEIIQNLLNSNAPRETIAAVLQMMTGGASASGSSNPTAPASPRPIVELPPQYDFKG